MLRHRGAVIIRELTKTKEYKANSSYHKVLLQRQIGSHKEQSRSRLQRKFTKRYHKLMCLLFLIQIKQVRKFSTNFSKNPQNLTKIPVVRVRISVLTDRRSDGHDHTNSYFRKVLCQQV
jgi:hypothetical protein